MQEAGLQKNGDAVAVTGVQAAISFSDAFTVAKLGLRSRGQDHQEVVRLISTVGTSTASSLAPLLQTGLNRKSEIEYGDRDVTLGDAARIAKAVRMIAKLVSAEI
jgi:hypothetical protein